MNSTGKQKKRLIPVPKGMSTINRTDAHRIVDGFARLSLERPTPQNIKQAAFLLNAAKFAQKKGILTRAQLEDILESYNRFEKKS